MAKDTIQGLQHTIGGHVTADDQVCGTAVNTGCLADGKNRGRRLNPPEFALHLLKRHWHVFGRMPLSTLSMTASTLGRLAQLSVVGDDTVNGRPLAFR